MENGGNAKVNAIFEARLEHFGTHAGKPSTHADGRTRERFIRDKYERRKFYDAAAFDRLQSASPDEEESSSEEETPKSKRNTGGKIAPLRAPSDAAKKRAESKRQKHLGKKTTKKASAPVPAPAPAAPEVDLLDFSDFSSVPMETPAPSSPVRVPPAQPPPPPPPDNNKDGTAAPALDLFASMTVSQENGDGTEDKTSFFAVASSAPAAEPPVPETKKVLNNDQIMSMFNSAPSQNQMGYGGFGGMNNMAVGNGMAAGGMMGNNMMGNNMMANPMMPQQNMMMPQQQPQQNNNNMMAFMGQSNQGMNVQMQMQMQQQQQQKVRMAMMMQQQKQQVPQQMPGPNGGT